MILPDKKIIDFIDDHHVLTLATSDFSTIWCSNMFYVYLEDIVAFLFTSNEDTTHIKQIKINSEVSGSIVLETKTIGKIQGIQLTGEVSKINETDFFKYKMKYLKKFPYAVLKDTPLWVLKAKTMKMTDNRLGFGKKLYWDR